MKCKHTVDLDFRGRFFCPSCGTLFSEKKARCILEEILGDGSVMAFKIIKLAQSKIVSELIIDNLENKG